MKDPFERAMVSSAVLNEVQYERMRQDNKWGEQDHDPAVWLTILGEEFGEACHAANHLMFDGHPHIAEGYRHELIQVAAVAVAAIENLDRRKS